MRIFINVSSAYLLLFILSSKGIGGARGACTGVKRMQKGLADSKGKEISIPSGYTVSAQFTAAGISLAWYKTDANGTVIDQKDADV